MKYLKGIVTFILSFVLIITMIMPVNAASETIQLGKAYKTKSYIAGIDFSYKVTTDGRYLYCLNRHKDTAQNIQAKLVNNSKYINEGVTYILKNGYPNKSITGDKDKDYYITQTAVWWLLDLVSGSTNLGDNFKETGSDEYQLRQHVKRLAYDGYSHRKDTSSSTQDVSIELVATNGNTMTLKDNYYTSSSIKANTKNISDYQVTLENAPEGTKILINNAVESTYTKAFTLKPEETFKVKVPSSSINDTETTLKVNATRTVTTGYATYEYQPVNTNMQNVALLEKIEKKANSSIQLNIDVTRVTINKTDTNTKQNIAGAKMVLKDSNGTVIASWVSTVNAHIIKNLAYGSYTIEETEAPNGYMLNKNVTSFTLSENQKTLTVYFENAPKKVVVNISKLDQNTNQQLAGAVLVVKNANGEEVAHFTTTDNSYVITDLPNGTYTVEEISAPAGYMKNNEKLTFTIDDNHLSHQINFLNAKEVYVPDTDVSALSSIIIALLGISIIGLGLGFIDYNAKLQKI